MVFKNWWQRIKTDRLRFVVVVYLCKNVFLKQQPTYQKEGYHKYEEVFISLCFVSSLLWFKQGLLT